MKKLFMILIFISSIATGRQLQILEKGTGTPLKRVEVKFSGQVEYTDPQGKIEVPDTTTKISLHKAGYEDLEIKKFATDTYYMLSLIHI